MIRNKLTNFVIIIEEILINFFCRNYFRNSFKRYTICFHLF